MKTCLSTDCPERTGGECNSSCMKISQEDMEKAARGATFMQKFKMEWWEEVESRQDEILHIPEKILDELALIAFKLLDK